MVILNEIMFNDGFVSYFNCNFLLLQLRMRKTLHVNWLLVPLLFKKNIALNISRKLII